MIGKLFFNLRDAYTDFGLVLKKGAYSELLSMPGAWPDETRKMALPILIQGNDESDFWVKYNALRAFLTSGNELVLEVKDLNRRYKVAYESMSSFTMLTRIKGGDKVYCEFVLNLVDDYPDVKLYSRTADFTSSNTGEVFTFTRTYTSYTLADAISMANSDTTFNIDGQASTNSNGQTIMKPAVYNFNDSYRNDGLQPLIISLKYKSGTPLDLSEATVRMQLRNSLGTLAWEFSSDLTGDNKLSKLDGGRVQLPRITSWDIPATKYYYDLEITTKDGNVRTYLMGSWRINQDITH